MALQLLTLPAVTVASGGTAVRLSSTSLYVLSVTIQADFANTSKVQIGSSGVTSSNGIEVPPGDIATIDAPVSPRGGSEEIDLKDVWINSSTTGDKVRVVTFVRPAG